MIDHRKPKFKELHESAQEELEKPLNQWLTIHLSLAGFEKGEATSNLCDLINIVHKIIGKLTTEYCSFGRLPDDRYPGCEYKAIPKAYYSIDPHAPRGKVEFYEDEKYYESQGPWHEYTDFAPNTDDNICHKYILKLKESTDG